MRTITKQNIMDTFGENCRKYRMAKGLTHEQFAEKMDVSSRVVYDWEDGLKCPTFPRVVMICKVLDVSLDSIMQ